MQTVFILFETDQWKTKDSRIFLGVFSTEDLAKDAARDQGIFLDFNASYEIIPVVMDTVEEI